MKLGFRSVFGVDFFYSVRNLIMKCNRLLLSFGFRWWEIWESFASRFCKVFYLYHFFSSQRDEFLRNTKDSVLQRDRLDQRWCQPLLNPFLKSSLSQKNLSFISVLKLKTLSVRKSLATLNYTFWKRWKSSRKYPCISAAANEAGE